MFRYVHISKTMLPEITICPTYPYNETTLAKNGILSRTNIQWDTQWISNDTSKSPKSFYKEAVLKAGKLI